MFKHDKKKKRKNNRIIETALECLEEVRTHSKRITHLVHSMNTDQEKRLKTIF